MVRSRRSIIGIVASAFIFGWWGLTWAEGAVRAEVVYADGGTFNIPWLLLAVFMVMFMWAGFVLLETGLTRAKNAAHTAFMVFFAPLLAVVGFWIVGAGVMNTGAGLLFRQLGANDDTPGHCLLELALVSVAVVIPIGAMAERWTLKSFYFYVLFVSALLFPVFGRWTWGGGWLRQLNFGQGFVDFAGAGVVHAVGGLCALAGCLVLGPRIGKYGKNGVVMPVLAHNVPLALAGSLILAVAWLALHWARALAFMPSGATTGMIAVVTLLAGTGGAVMAAVYITFTTGKPDPTLVANGLLAGLVASSGSAAFVGPGSAFVIGGVAGLLACLAVKWLDLFQVDDPVGAIAVHGVGGLWGVIAVGLFANSDFVHGFFYGGSGQLLAQLIGCAVLAVWAFGVPWVFFTMLNRFVPMRVAPEMEREGLDVSETGVLGYPDFQHHSEEGRLRW